MSDNEVVISDVYLYVSMPSIQMTGTTPVRRREENTQENIIMINDGGNVGGDECWSR